MAYFEIEDIGRIDKLGKAFARQLRSEAVHKENRKVGYPSAHDFRDVVFLQDNEHHALWYCHWISADNKAVNLFGHGEYGGNQTLTIDAQFNYRVDDYSRRLGAVFLENPVSGEIVLAHRGIVTRGNRVNKEAVLDVMASRVVEADTTKGIKEFLVIASWDPQTLVEDISAFALDLRNALREMEIVTIDDEDADDEDTNEDDGQDEGGSADDEEVGGFGGLRTYFEEFSGKRRSFTPKKVYPECNHGKVVDALKEALAHTGETLKSRAIDLVVNQAKLAILFEVKTDAGSQNVYTAIGQLSIHTPTVIRFTKKRVKCVMVVPERPMESLAEVVEMKLDVIIIAYRLSATGKVTFEGLEQFGA